MSLESVLKRTWQTLWRYRALWVMGFILALASFSWVGGIIGSIGSRIIAGLDWQSLRIDQADFLGLNALAVVVLVLYIPFTMAAYVSEVALIRAVDRRDETGEQQGFLHGFRLGWSRAAWRIFLIDLLISAPATLLLGFLLALMFALLGVLVIPSLPTVIGVFGLLAVIGLFFLTILLAVVVAVALDLLKHFARRACTLDGLGVIDGIRQGYGVIRQNLKDVGLMWLVMLGVSMGWSFVMAPIRYLLMAVFGVTGGAAALLAHNSSGVGSAGSVAAAVAVTVGLAFVVLVLEALLTLLSGLGTVFQSAAWTLTYRDLRATKGPTPEEPAAGESATGEYIGSD